MNDKQGARTRSRQVVSWLPPNGKPDPTLVAKLFRDKPDEAYGADLVEPQADSSRRRGTLMSSRRTNRGNASQHAADACVGGNPPTPVFRGLKSRRYAAMASRYLGVIMPYLDRHL